LRDSPPQPILPIAEHEPLGERRLACAVIEAAWIEFLGFNRRDSDLAREWFLSTASSFPAWCEIAGLPAGSAQRIRIKVIDTSPLWFESAEAQAKGLPAPSQQTPTRQRVHAATGDRGRPRKERMTP
jgi:hypothetical protein